MLDVSVRVDITGVRGTRLEGKAAPNSSGSVSGPVKFGVNAKLEEKERKTGQIIVFFVLSVGTKPSVVKFELEGYATLTGREEALGKMLEVDPKTGVPFVFHRVYQHSFMAIYLLATLMDAIYPPPDLLFSGEKQLGTGSNVAKPENEPAQYAQPVAAANSQGSKQ